MKKFLAITFLMLTANVLLAASAGTWPNNWTSNSTGTVIFYYGNTNAADLRYCNFNFSNIITRLDAIYPAGRNHLSTNLCLWTNDVRQVRRIYGIAGSSYITNFTYHGNGYYLTNLSVNVLELTASGRTDAKYLRGDNTWNTPAGAGDMLKEDYDTNTNLIVDTSDTFIAWTNTGVGSLSKTGVTYTAGSSNFLYATGRRIRYIGNTNYFARGVLTAVTNDFKLRIVTLEGRFSGGSATNALQFGNKLPAHYVTTNESDTVALTGLFTVDGTNVINKITANYTNTVTRNGTQGMLADLTMSEHNINGISIVQNTNASVTIRSRGATPGAILNAFTSDGTFDLALGADFYDGFYISFGSTYLLKMWTNGEANCFGNTWSNFTAGANVTWAGNTIASNKIAKVSDADRLDGYSEERFVATNESSEVNISGALKKSGVNVVTNNLDAEVTALNTATGALNTAKLSLITATQTLNSVTGRINAITLDGIDSSLFRNDPYITNRTYWYSFPFIRTSAVYHVRWDSALIGKARTITKIYFQADAPCSVWVIEKATNATWFGTYTTNDALTVTTNWGTETTITDPALGAGSLVGIKTGSGGATQGMISVEVKFDP